METMSENLTPSSVYVAPLQIYKGQSPDLSSRDTQRSDASMHNSSWTGSLGYEAQITPPATPNGSQEELSQHFETPQPVFHNFLRTIYPFHPTDAVSDSTVTLPLNEGDVILVHSIHTNGWADGTLLVSGARGWLPTNYCEAYDPDSMRSLLKALLCFYDLLRSMPSEDEVFCNQEFMRGIIAGVRYLLERSNCLTRDSPMIQGNDGLRRNRKALLSDLSSLVKTAKQLQENRKDLSSRSEDENGFVDDMVLKAFKIVTRGVRFLDVLEDDTRTRRLVNKAMAVVKSESSVPPTPPADSTSFEHAKDADSHSISNRSSMSGTGSQGPDEQTKQHSDKRVSFMQAGISKVSSPFSIQLKRHSIAHRLSTAGPFLAAQRQNCVSEKLNSCHDTLLSYLGSLIGRLHLQSQSTGDLLLTIRQSITAGRCLLTVVEAVCAHDSQSEEALHHARSIMYHRINQLILAARECVMNSEVDEEDAMMPHENARLKGAATDCVVAAGECVAKTKFVIERIGDFELYSVEQGLGIDMASFGSTHIDDVPINNSPPEPSARPPPPPPSTTSEEKPLPHVPSTETTTTAFLLAPENSEDAPTCLDNEEPAGSLSHISLLPPLPNLTSTLLLQETYTPSEQSGSGNYSDFQSSSASIAVSSCETSSTCLSSSMRDSETSMLSQTSTRATTPDMVPYIPAHHSSLSNLSNSESQSTLAEIDDTESKMLEKTYAHELLYNKERQVTGGTLPALVETLTTHDSTPDAMFVSTFYLTFRLFVTPRDFAQALVDRFDYVSESINTAAPVRLRVYNVFKGWLESHWRESLDHDALEIIELFAQEKLSLVLPAAGRRLLELTQKVSCTDGPLVPRLVSSMGKTSTSVAQYISPDTPLPAPVMPKSSINGLKNWKMGGTAPTILDFDPLELARQFTIKEMNIFCSILPEELLASEWMKKSGSNALNVRAMSTLSTDLSNLVADTILQHEDAKKRAVLIKHWIKIAQKCFELNNYDSLMAIICSLNSSTITRLKKTWDMVSTKRKDVLKVLQDIMEPTKNHAVLRQLLHDHVPPCLPFVGTYLTDLTFVDIGNPATKQLPGVGGEAATSVINFDKHTRTAKIIGDLQRFQIPYRLTEVPEMQEWIQAQIVRVRCSNDLNNVQEYYRKSLLLEPKASSQKTTPTEPQSSFPSQTVTKERFDLFAWTHSRDKTPTPTLLLPTPM